jgi:hypothetical protein
MESSCTNAFVTYACDACETDVCERIALINLALGYEETVVCLNCLVVQEEIEATTLLRTTKAYIQSRDCFKKPWNAIDISACPLAPHNLCVCHS